MKPIILGAITAVMLFAGCGGLNFYRQLDLMVSAKQFQEAAGIIETQKNQYKGNNELIYFLDKGAVMQMLGDYKQSTYFLNTAEQIVEELYTKSVTGEIGAFLSNDLSLPYAGEDFEQVMINIMKCLNFMYKGDFSGAQIEARRVNHRLNVISDKLEGKNNYKEDAFARYLGAIAYESTGDINSAYIDYKKALKAYERYRELYGTEIPRSLRADVLRMADAMGFNDDVERFQKEWGEKVEFERHASFSKKGEVIAVIYDGMPAYKKSYYTTHPVADKKNNKTYIMRMAFPKFVPRPFNVASAEIVYGDKKVSGFVAQDVSSIAVRNLADNILLISAKAIARATVKFLAAQALRNENEADPKKRQTGQILGALADIYNIVSEQADTRSWRTLPGRFHLVRMPLIPGKHTVTVRLTGLSGAVREEQIEVHAKRGKKTVIPIFAYSGL